MITEQDRAFIVWRDNHDPRKYPAERDAFKAGWNAAIEADRKRRVEPVGIVKRPSEAHYPGVQWLTDVKDGDQLYTAQSGGGDGS